MKRSIILLLGAVLVLTACDATTTADGPRAGGEDFPNAVNALGRALALGMDSTQDWNGLDSASTEAGLGGSALQDSAAGLAARSLALCKDGSSFDILSGDTKALFQKTTCLAGTLTGSVHDSLVIAYYPGITEKAIDTVYWMSTDSSLLGYQNFTWLEPHSRAYFLVKGDTGKVWYNVRRKSGRWTDFTHTLADGGNDRILGTDKDNTYWSSSRSLVKNADASPDTAWAVWIQSAVAGQPVIGAADSGLVRATRLDRYLARRKVESGLLMAHRDETRNYAQLWSARTDWNSGLTRWQTVYGNRSDSSFRSRDTVRFLDRFRHADKLDSTRVEATAILGASLARHDQDSMLSIRYERYRSSLVERHTIWQIQSDNPVANGSESKSGTIFARVEFADTSYAHAAYAQFHGRWDATVFVGTWSNGEDSATIRVSRNGVVLSSTKL
jgi:hypothetical protein